MRIDDWPLDRIMRLPDWCFGRRFMVFCCGSFLGTGENYIISEQAFPERMVIWEARIDITGIDCQGQYLRLALGDTLPTTVAEMDQLTPLFRGLGRWGNPPRNIDCGLSMNWHMTQLRIPMETANKRMIMACENGGPATEQFRVSVVVSSFPREVPDWLTSAQAINLP